MSFCNSDTYKMGKFSSLNWCNIGGNKVMCAYLVYIFNFIKLKHETHACGKNCRQVIVNT